MAKFANPSKLEQKVKDAILIRFCQALCSLDNPAEAAQFLRDLLSPQELEMMAKRLKIADLIIKEKTYSEISWELKVGQSTIARVHEWLKISGEGFRMVLERSSNEQEPVELNNLKLINIRKKYPIYYWPQILLESIVKSASVRDKKRLKSILRSMDKKTALYKQLDHILGR